MAVNEAVREIFQAISELTAKPENAFPKKLRLLPQLAFSNTSVHLLMSSYSFMDIASLPGCVAKMVRCGSSIFSSLALNDD
jgi:hypothetical protein